MAEQKSFFVRRWKLILNIVTIAALVLSAWFLRKDLGDTIKNFENINAWYILLLLPIEALNYHAQAKLYQGMFSIVGNDLSYRFLLRASVELNFVNHVFPSGGAAGISYFGLRLKKGNEITAAKATLIHVMKLALTFLSFELLLAFAMIALAVAGRVNNLMILVGTLISTLLVVGTGVFAYVVGSKTRINSLFLAVTRLLNRVISWFKRGNPEVINLDKARDVFDDFHDNYQELRKDLPRLKAPFWWGLVANTTEVLAVYAVFFAFGEKVNIGAVILAYAVANFAGLVSVLPGGVGVYEFLMTAVLATAGVSVAVSIPVIVMYRVVNTLIQVPAGYVLYQRYLAQGGRPANDA